MTLIKAIVSSGSATTTATRTFASYLGWSSSSSAVKKIGDHYENNTSFDSQNIAHDECDVKKVVDTIFESQPADAEEKEERESLPPEFDEDTQNRYFERKDKGNVRA